MTHGPLSPTAYRLFESTLTGSAPLTGDAEIPTHCGYGYEYVLVFAIWWCNHIFRLQPFKPRTFVRIRTYRKQTGLRRFERIRTIVSRQAYGGFQPSYIDCEWSSTLRCTIRPLGHHGSIDSQSEYLILMHFLLFVCFSLEGIIMFFLLVYLLWQTYLLPFETFKS
jgi:hypothetical protein